MGTEARLTCPVCSEPYDSPPAECFRCETPLDAWWRFEEALARPAPEPVRSPRALPLALAALAGALATAVTLRVMTGTAHAPAAPRALPAVAAPAAPPPSPVAVAAPPRVTTYRVQPGDSLWRVAAALTGDGRNWRTLWPERDPTRPLAVGTVLEVR